MSMDQSTGAERERVAQQERADARERVQAAQDQEVATRVEQRAEQRWQAVDYARTRRARERARAAAGNVTAAPAARDPVEREGEGGEGGSSLQTNVAST